MPPLKPSRRRAPITKRRQERELFFWTARQALALIVLVAFVVYTVVSLIHGHVPVEQQILQLLRGP